MKYMRFIAGVAALSLFVTPTAAMAAPVVGDESPAPTPSVTKADKMAALSGEKERPAADSEIVKVMVMLATQPDQPGNELGNLAKVQDLADQIADKYQATIDRSFGYLVAGFSAEVRRDQIADIAAEKGVASVQPVKMYYPTMDTAAQMTQSIAARGSFDVDGAGMVVSIIDTGIDMQHQDMRLDDGVATKLQPQPGFTAKVPYGYNFADENTEVKDTTSSQHGMHVAGIVAANGGADASISANGRINGVAPNAQLLAMKVFSNDPPSVVRPVMTSSPPSKSQ